MQEIQIERTKNPKQKPTDQSKLGFGKIFTDHMYIMPYNKEQGWHCLLYTSGTDMGGEPTAAWL